MKNFAQRAKQIETTYGVDSGTSRKLLKELYEEQQKFASGGKITLEKEVENGIEVEKEHAPTLKFAKEYLAKTGELPPLEKFAKSITMDHEKDFRKLSDNPQQSYYQRLIENNLSDEKSEYAMGGSVKPVNLSDAHIEAIRMMARGGSLQDFYEDRQTYDQNYAKGGQVPPWIGMPIPGRMFADGGAIASTPAKIYDRRMYEVYRGPASAEFKGKDGKLIPVGDDQGASMAPAPERAMAPSKKYPKNKVDYMPIVRKYFPADQWDNAAKIIQAESGGDAGAFRRQEDNPGGGEDHGLFQINSKYHPEAYQGGDIHDPEHNVRMAANIWKKRGWREWTTGKNMGMRANGGDLNSFALGGPDDPSKFDELIKSGQFIDPRTTTDRWVESLVKSAPQFAPSADLFKGIGNFLGAPINYATGTLDPETGYAAMLPTGRVSTLAQVMGPRSGASMMGSAFPKTPVWPKGNAVFKEAERNLPTLHNNTSSSLMRQPNWRMYSGTTPTPSANLPMKSTNWQFYRGQGQQAGQTSPLALGPGSSAAETVATRPMGPGPTLASEAGFASDMSNLRRFFGAGLAGAGLYAGINGLGDKATTPPIIKTGDDGFRVPGATTPLPGVTGPAVPPTPPLGAVLPLNGYIGDADQRRGMRSPVTSGLVTPPIAGMQDSTYTSDMLTGIQEGKDARMNNAMRYAPVISNLIPGKRPSEITNDISLPRITAQKFAPDYLSTAPITEQLGAQYRTGVGELAGASGGSAAAMRAGLQGLNRGMGRSASEALTTINEKNLGLKNAAQQYNLESVGKANEFNALAGAKETMARKDLDVTNKELSQGYKNQEALRRAAAFQQIGQIAKEKSQSKLAEKIYGYAADGSKITDPKKKSLVVSKTKSFNPSDALKGWDPVNVKKGKV